MKSINDHESLRQAATASQKECWWMQATVVDYKLCDRDFDCENCPFDQVLQGRVTEPAFASTTTGEGSALDRERKTRNRRCIEYASDVSRNKVAGALFYHPTHSWVRIEDGGCIRIGLDDFAVRILGRPYKITLPVAGKALRFGEGCWQYTHQAGVTVLVAPVAGCVKETNQALANQPALLNRDPYGEGWALLIEPADLKSSLQRLLYGPKVSRWYEREIQKLRVMASGMTNRNGIAGTTMNDGGSLTEDFMNGFTVDQRRLIIGSFFPLSLVEKVEANQAIIIKK